MNSRSCFLWKTADLLPKSVFHRGSCREDLSINLPIHDIEKTPILLDELSLTEHINGDIDAKRASPLVVVSGARQGEAVVLSTKRSVRQIAAYALCRQWRRGLLQETIAGLPSEVGLRFT